MSEWKVYKLEDIVSFSQGFQISTDQQYEVKEKDMDRFIRIVDYTNKNEKPRYIKKIDKRYWAYKDDVVMIRYGSNTAGKVVRGLSGYIANNMFKVNIIDNNILDKEFLYYFLSQECIYKYLMSSQSSSTMPAIKFSDLYKIDAYLPTIEQQRKVATFLNYINDKIQLNTQINQTLESMAQAIFKSWFVDFDPVHAKANALADGASDEQATLSAMSVISGKSADELIAMNRQNPDHYQQLWEIASAFPSGFDGEVPLGWESVALSKICSMQNGYAFKSSDWRDEGISVIKIGSIQSNIVTVEGNGFVENKFLQEKQDFILRDGDIVITGAYVGKAGIIPKNKIAMMNQRVAKFIPNQILNNLPYHSYVYYISQQKDLQDYIDYTAKGSAQPNISTTEILKYQIILADTDIHVHFEKVIQPFLDAILENSVENETLSQIRDELLPKLLSGEIKL